ncbi:MAG TPA: CRISPR-associated protein Cas4 [Candidatus Gastranaerophilales bacterium]|nr:CRISPR-associated protein Cas4 [Candidatus Gastranaerophilales bacterium]
MANITASDVIEYLYCPRFIYFMRCLDIPQHEEKRYKVQKGRDIHLIKAEVNKNYLRKKLNVVRKEINVPLNSEKYNIHGILDEILFVEDGSAMPFDYKFAEYKEKLFSTHFYQSNIYALLIQENFNAPVNKGFVCYTRSSNLVKEMNFSAKSFSDTQSLINDVVKVIETGYFPPKTKSANKCPDCCYKNICVR